MIAVAVGALCGPGGLALGLVALSRGTEPNSTDQICAWIAVIWGACAILICLGLCAFQLLSTW